MLAQLVVDWYAPTQAVLRWCISRAGGAAAKAALAAYCDEIPNSIVATQRLRSTLWKWRERTALRKGSIYSAYTQTDASFAKAVSTMALPPHDVFFGYSYSSLETLEVERKRGIFTMLGQIDPGPREFRLVAEEMGRFPELAGPPLPFPSAYFDRTRREWQLADVIVVNSEWSRDALIAEGVDQAKIRIVPLAYEADEAKSNSFCGPASCLPLKILWLGQVNVRKGIHHLIEAARFMQPGTVEFLIAGPVNVLPDVLRSAPSNMRWLGRIPRSEVTALYRKCHAFVLPTLSDGFAITQLEALAHGLPVITTPNCGQIVENGVTGFIVPSGNPESLANALQAFVRNPDLASEMAPACRASASAYSVDAYARRLLEIIQTGLAGRA